MKGTKIIIIAGILMTVLLSACNRNAADMVVDGGVTIDEKTNTVTFQGSLTDKQLEPDTPFQVRFYLEGKTVRNALGTDLVYVDGEFKSHKQGEASETIEVRKTIDIKKPEEIDKLVNEIKNKEEKAVTIEIINDAGRIDEEVLHSVSKE
ncbi:hypothetical protein LS684_23575 (plasmid) [Cytobacillus spongiae]|uniref:hypothetical protein n=1 Tax=Cytobacillus spongiae TaxID=2901381 RepID=UPI00145E02A3|nr:hypothetical protein [Cytobacillus spongiae]MCA1062968.1 hypothetical protein [Rossellomorea aquimaris]NMH70301.1 hypothetical protein [Bacillus sp. RO3]UII58570.1 hypothetical protein LS684_23575 [Cytobacillus spongiae]WJV28407.1 hypothetical protein QTG56_15050 [Rossellomorea sp. AcN35-11]